MRTAVVYYSFTGNTHRLAQVIIGVLKSKGEDAIPVRIRPLKEEKKFLVQCKDSFLRKKPELYKTLLDLKDYDRVIIGSPVWAFAPAPAINTYIDKCQSLHGKDVFCFVTYGSGAGKEKALETMKEELQAKGAEVKGSMLFQQAENLESCKKKIQDVL